MATKEKIESSVITRSLLRMASSCTPHVFIIRRPTFFIVFVEGCCSKARPLHTRVEWITRPSPRDELVRSSIVVGENLRLGCLPTGRFRIYDPFYLCMGGHVTERWHKRSNVGLIQPCFPSNALSRTVLCHTLGKRFFKVLTCVIMGPFW